MNTVENPRAVAPAAGMQRPVFGPVRCVWPGAAALGEGLLWSVREQALYWVDILSCRLHRWHQPSGALQHWTFNEHISALAERAGAAGLIVAMRRGFAVFDPAQDDAPIYLHQPEDEPLGNRFNDGACDALGRFWVGSMDFDCTAPTGALYRFDPDGRCTQHETGFAVTNGPTWALDAGRLCLYFNDTVNGETLRYDFDPVAGTLSNRQLWHRMAPGDGLPDGMATDALGRVWIAHWGGACVSCHDPVTAEELGRVVLPTSHVTNCSFGGPELQTLFISTARQGLSPAQLAAEPLAGAVFAVEVDSPGLPAHLFGA